jgi:hypothetical protein
VEVRQYNTVSLLEVRSKITALPEGDLRRELWIRMCAAGQAMHTKVNANQNAELPCPAALVNWQEPGRFPG